MIFFIFSFYDLCVLSANHIPWHRKLTSSALAVKIQFLILYISIRLGAQLHCVIALTSSGTSSFSGTKLASASKHKYRYTYRLNKYHGSLPFSCWKWYSTIFLHDYLLITLLHWLFMHRKKAIPDVGYTDVKKTPLSGQNIKRLSLSQETRYNFQT